MSMKDAMACFTTGVTVVTTHHDSQDWGMTCNSFNTVSLEPALVLWSIRKESHSHAAFLQGGGYVVNVLGAQQRQTAMQFSSGTQAERFSGSTTQRTALHRLRLTEAIAWFDCRLSQVVSAGDHDILIAEVVDFGMQAGPGLAYSKRSFGVITALP